MFPFIFWRWMQHSTVYESCTVYAPIVNNGLCFLVSGGTPSFKIAEPDTIQSTRADYLPTYGRNFLYFPTSRWSSLRYSRHDSLCNCLGPPMAGDYAICLSNAGFDITHKCTLYEKAVTKRNLLFLIVCRWVCLGVGGLWMASKVACSLFIYLDSTGN
jgi:hypothetical protein